MSRGSISQLQVAILEILLEKSGEYISYNALDSYIRQKEIFPPTRTTEMARIQILKTIRILENKLAEYSLRRDAPLDYASMEIERIRGKGVRLSVHNVESSSVESPPQSNTQQYSPLTERHYSDLVSRLSSIETQLKVLTEVVDFYGSKLEELSRQPLIKKLNDNTPRNSSY